MPSSGLQRFRGNVDDELQGAELSMLVESPEGNVTFMGTLADDAQCFRAR
jgi:hypothetical protein